MKYKVGDKFIVEIERIREDKKYPYELDVLYSVAEYHLNRLPRLENGVDQSSYEKGMEDAWKMATKIYKPVSEGGLTGEVIRKYFGCSSDDIHELSIQEVAKGLKQYEEDRNLDWTKVPKDTPVLVKNKVDQTWKNRYFSRYEDGVYYVYDNGATSWSGFCEVSYEEAKLAEE